jgi:hypothetical protein
VEKERNKTNADELNECAVKEQNEFVVQMQNELEAEERYRISVKKAEQAYSEKRNAKIPHSVKSEI